MDKNEAGSMNETNPGTVEVTPCPFCGGDELGHGYEMAGSYFAGNVQCYTCNAYIVADSEADAIAAWNTRAAQPQPAATVQEVGREAKPWYETDAHRDLSRIIPDMEGKIAEAKTRYGHCLPDHLFAPLEASITELRVLRHELAVPSAEGRLREALTYYANDEHYDGGDVPGHIYVLDDHGRTARDALAHPSPAPQQPQSVEKLREALEQIAQDFDDLPSSAANYYNLACEQRDIAKRALPHKEEATPATTTTERGRG